MPYVGYEDFGRRFLEYAAYEQRISDAFAQLTGAAFDLGPIGVGPAELAKVAAQVRLGEPKLQRFVDQVITATACATAGG
ncbi:hypothetical protein ACW2Q0_08815 [Nocardia sp. R16R-3T]